MREILKIYCCSGAVVLVLVAPLCLMDPCGRAGALREPKTHKRRAMLQHSGPMSDDVTLAREAGGSHRVALQDPLAQGSHSNCDP